MERKKWGVAPGRGENYKVLFSVVLLTCIGPAKKHNQKCKSVKWSENTCSQSYNMFLWHTWNTLNQKHSEVNWKPLWKAKSYFLFVYKKSSNGICHKLHWALLSIVSAGKLSEKNIPVKISLFTIIGLRLRPFILFINMIFIFLQFRFFLNKRRTTHMPKKLLKPKFETTNSNMLLDTLSVGSSTMAS